MEECHAGDFVVGRARLHQGADNHFDQAPAHAIEDGGDAKPSEWRHQRRKDGQPEEAGYNHRIRHNKAKADSDSLGVVRRKEIHHELGAEVHDDKDAKLRQRDAELLLEVQEEKWHVDDHERLRGA